MEGIDDGIDLCEYKIIAFSFGPIDDIVPIAIWLSTPNQTVVAAGGYQTVARVANIAAPWMIAVFAACGIVSLGQMEATNMNALSEGKFWSDAIAFVQEKNGPEKFGFWQIVVFAWLCNGAMHFGMADLSIFRFAKSKASGWAPSIGMFIATPVWMNRESPIDAGEID